jgi:hypothetical protein
VKALQQPSMLVCRAIRTGQISLQLFQQHAAFGLLDHTQRAAEIVPIDLAGAFKQRVKEVLLHR